MTLIRATLTGLLVFYVMIYIFPRDVGTGIRIINSTVVIAIYLLIDYIFSNIQLASVVSTVSEADDSNIDAEVELVLSRMTSRADRDDKKGKLIRRRAEMESRLPDAPKPRDIEEGFAMF